MSAISVDFAGLYLSSGLKARLAECLSETATEIPLHLCFLHRGLGFRSAIALKLQQQNSASPESLAHQYLDNLATLPPLVSPQSWTYEAIATDQGWLEFWLNPLDLGRWLDLLAAYGGDDSELPQTRLIPAPPFGFQYLCHRCQSLVNLAAEIAPERSPQWHFTITSFPDWEQNLLEAIACFGLALGEQQFHHRLLAKVEQAFWEFERHCHLFDYLRRSPELGEHYLRWFDLLQRLFTTCLTQIYGVMAIAEI